MLPVVLGLSAATCIGFSNIVAGITARRLTPLIVGFWSQATGAVWCALLLLALRPPLLPGQIAAGLIAGLAGGAGMVLFYRSMAAGAISLVAPITACSVVFPVIYAIASGETPTLPVAAGLVAIIGGILLASLRPTPVRGDPPDTRISTDGRAIALAIGAAAAFGAFFILIDFAPPASGWGALWTAGAVRFSGFGVQIALALLGPRRLAWPGRYAPAVALAGTLDLTVADPDQLRIDHGRLRHRHRAGRSLPGDRGAPRGRLPRRAADPGASDRRDAGDGGRLAGQHLGVMRKWTPRRG